VAAPFSFSIHYLVFRTPSNIPTVDISVCYSTFWLQSEFTVSMKKTQITTPTAKLHAIPLSFQSKMLGYGKQHIVAPHFSFLPVHMCTKAQPTKIYKEKMATVSNTLTNVSNILLLLSTVLIVLQ